MTNNVVYIQEFTTEEIPTERVLEAAIKESLTKVLVIGLDKDDMFYAASSTGDVTLLLTLIKQIKEYLEGMIE